MNTPKSVACSKVIVGTRGSVVFTVGKWAEPHHPKIDNAKKTFLSHLDGAVRNSPRFAPFGARCN